MSKLSRLLTACAVAAALSACAAPQYDASAHYFGDLDLDRDRQASTAGNEIPRDQKVEVRIIQGSLPEGLALTDNGARIGIAPGYESRYQVLGTVKSEWSGKSNFIRSVYWYVEMREDQRGREIYCKIQAPFRALTLSFWSMFVPLNYPCFVGTPKGDENIAEHIGKLKRAAQGMGANMVIIAGRGDTAFVSTNGTVLSTIEGQSLTGYAIIDKGEQAAPIPGPTTTSL